MYLFLFIGRLGIIIIGRWTQIRQHAFGLPLVLPSLQGGHGEGGGGADRVCPPRSCEVCLAVFRLNAAERERS